MGVSGATFPGVNGSSPHGFALVGIGASAGGLDALKRFFGKIKPDDEIATPNHTKAMRRLLLNFFSASLRGLRSPR